MRNDFIKVQNLTKAYKMAAGELNVLKGVDFELGPQESVAITGPSGSGKSTLLNLLCGLLKPDSGHVSIDEKNLESLEFDELRKHSERDEQIACPECKSRRPSRKVSTFAAAGVSGGGGCSSPYPGRFT